MPVEGILVFFRERKTELSLFLKTNKKYAHRMFNPAVSPAFTRSLSSFSSLIPFNVRITSMVSSESWLASVQQKCYSCSRAFDAHHSAPVVLSFSLSLSRCFSRFCAMWGDGVRRMWWRILRFCVPGTLTPQKCGELVGIFCDGRQEKFSL